MQSLIILSAYLSLPWPADAPPPKIELYACLVLAGTGIILLPVLLGAAFLKLGNLANDGIKLGRHLSACSRDPPSSLLTNNPDNSKCNRELIIYLRRKIIINDISLLTYLKLFVLMKFGIF